jgi:diazepam-binding inhibitor (GABA receptor modulator, acyl-CoA-binding protein)
MSLDERFEQAQERVKQLKERPDNFTLLELYALFKQGTVGDAEDKRPGAFDFKGRAKWDAWASKKGTPREDAKQLYIDLVNQLVSASEV